MVPPSVSEEEAGPVAWSLRSCSWRAYSGSAAVQNHLVCLLKQNVQLFYEAAIPLLLSTQEK